jgi:hypothetical protein
MDDARLTGPVRKAYIHKFVMSFLRHEHFTTPFKVRKHLADLLEEQEPQDVLESLRADKKGATSAEALRMLRNLMSKYGAN